MFYDYDCHGVIKKGYFRGGIKEFNEDLLNLLKICNESTNDMGKLYISYPMVEALWDIPQYQNFENCNNNCFVNICDLKRYKHQITNKNIERSRPMSKALWKKYLSIHLDRFLICTNSKETDNLTKLSYFDIIDYDLIKLHSIETHLAENYDEVFAISPFPLFLLEIGGEKQFKEFIINLNEIEYTCNYEKCVEIFKEIDEEINN